MALHGLIHELKGLVDAGTVLKFAEADLNDLLLLSEVEVVLKQAVRTPE